MEGTVDKRVRVEKGSWSDKTGKELWLAIEGLLHSPDTQREVILVLGASVDPDKVLRRLSAAIHGRMSYNCCICLDQRFLAVSQLVLSCALYADGKLPIESWFAVPGLEVRAFSGFVHAWYEGRPRVIADRHMIDTLAAGRDAH